MLAAGLTHISSQAHPIRPAGTPAGHSAQAPTCQHQLLQGDQLGQPVQVGHVCDPVAGHAEVVQACQLVQVSQAAQTAACQAEMAQPVAACSAGGFVSLKGCSGVP